MDYWKDRLDAAETATRYPTTERFGRTAIQFRDHDGQPLELITGDFDIDPWADGPVPAEHALRGFHGVTIQPNNARPHDPPARPPGPALERAALHSLSVRVPCRGRDGPGPQAQIPRRDCAVEPVAGNRGGVGSMESLEARRFGRIPQRVSTHPCLRASGASGARRSAGVSVSWHPSQCF